MHMVRKLLLVVFLFSAGPLLATDLLHQLERVNIPKPTVGLKGVSIKSITLEDIQLLLETDVNNPYPIGLPGLGMNVNLNIEGTRLLKLSNSKVTAPAKQATAVPFDLKLKYQDLVNIYKKVTGKEVLSMDLDGAVSLPLPVDKLKKRGLFFQGMPRQLAFPFKTGHALPAVLPKIDLRNFRIIQPSTQDIKSAVKTDQLADRALNFVSALLSSGGKNPGSAVKAGLADVDLPINTEFEIAMSNSAASRIAFETLNYDLFLGKEKFLGGRSTKIENRGKESIVTVKTSFPLRSVSAGIASAIKARKTAFRLSGGSDLQVPALPGDGKVPFNFNKTGDLKW
jgi:LEA14-like dessication related protein